MAQFGNDGLVFVAVGRLGGGVGAARGYAVAALLPGPEPADFALELAHKPANQTEVIKEADHGNEVGHEVDRREQVGE